MCYHSVKEMNEARRQARLRDAKLDVIIMRSPKTGKFEEAYLCDVLNPQSISNTIRNLHAWHPGDKIVDLTQVNARRAEYGLDMVDEKSLPKPTGSAPRSEDEFRADEKVDPRLKKLKFDTKPLPEPTQEELVAAYDAAQAKKREEMLAKRPKPDAAPAVDLTQVGDREFINALARA